MGGQLWIFRQSTMNIMLEHFPGLFHLKLFISLSQAVNKTSCFNTSLCKQRLVMHEGSFLPLHPLCTLAGSWWHSRSPSPPSSHWDLIPLNTAPLLQKDCNDSFRFQSMLPSNQQTSQCCFLAMNRMITIFSMWTIRIPVSDHTGDVWGKELNLSLFLERREDAEEVWSISMLSLIFPACKTFCSALLSLAEIAFNMQNWCLIAQFITPLSLNQE